MAVAGFRETFYSASDAFPTSWVFAGTWCFPSMHSSQHCLPDNGPLGGGCFSFSSPGSLVSRGLLAFWLPTVPPCEMLLCTGSRTPSQTFSVCLGCFWERQHQGMRPLQRTTISLSLRLGNWYEQSLEVKSAQVTTGHADGGCLGPPVLSSQADAWLGNASPPQQLVKRWLTELHCMWVQHCAQRVKWWGWGIDAFPRISALMTAPLSINGSCWLSLWTITGCKDLLWSVPIAAHLWALSGFSWTSSSGESSQGSFACARTQDQASGEQLLTHKSNATYLNELSYAFIRAVRDVSF